MAPARIFLAGAIFISAAGLKQCSVANITFTFLPMNNIVGRTIQSWINLIPLIFVTNLSK
jgi:hypothetical protein